MYVIVHGDIADIDYVSVTGPFATVAEANREGERLMAEGKLPDENENGGETAWRVKPLVAPAALTADYEEDGDY